MNKWMDGRMDGWMDGLMDGGVLGWMFGRASELVQFIFV
jgi:hypothetical protein